MLNYILMADYGYIFMECWFYWSLAYYIISGILSYLYYRRKGTYTYSILEVLIGLVFGLFGPFTFFIMLLSVGWTVCEKHGQEIWDKIVKDRTIVSNSTKLKTELDTTLD